VHTVTPNRLHDIKVHWFGGAQTLATGTALTIWIGGLYL